MKLHYLKLGMMGDMSNLTFGRQRQVDLYESKATLFCTVSSRIARTRREREKETGEVGWGGGTQRLHFPLGCLFSVFVDCASKSIILEGS